MSFITPITVMSFLPMCTISPTGFLRFMYFTADWFSTMADESAIILLLKSRPSVNCQPTVFPYSEVLDHKAIPSPCLLLHRSQSCLFCRCALFRLPDF